MLIIKMSPSQIKDKTITKNRFRATMLRFLNRMHLGCIVANVLTRARHQNSVRRTGNLEKRVDSYAQARVERWPD